MKKNLLLSALFAWSLIGLKVHAQTNTVGIISLDVDAAHEGYNLIYPHNQPNVYLLDVCGEIVNVWEDDEEWRPGGSVYLRDDGSLVKTKRAASIIGDPIWAGGGGGIIEIRSWENELIWSFEMNDADNRLHHDIAIRDNGNILAIAWERKTGEEAIQAGRLPESMTDDELWPDWVFEIDPETDEIVWEWHAWDHLVQDVDSELDNFGVVGQEPERIDINWDTQEGDPDWMHSNSIDYNELTGQIMLSVPHFDEIWIIDRTTDTEEAASSSGGLSGRGGDLMYRWGNPQTYDAGTAADQKLFFQHDAHWTSNELSVGDPNFGRIAIFNNQIGPDFSAGHYLADTFDEYEWGYAFNGTSFGPADFATTMTHPEPTAMHSTGLSGLQALPNGNTLFLSGRQGYGFELTQTGEVAYEYVVPLSAGQAIAQGSVLSLNENITFRMTRFAPDHPALEGRDLSPMGYLELDPDLEVCASFTSIDEVDIDALTIYPNPAVDRITIEGLDEQTSLTLIDASGRVVRQEVVLANASTLHVGDLAGGVYLLRVGQSAGRLILIHR